jgi:hypothetical protein
LALAALFTTTLSLVRNTVPGKRFQNLYRRQKAGMLQGIRQTKAPGEGGRAGGRVLARRTIGLVELGSNLHRSSGFRD